MIFLGIAPPWLEKNLASRTMEIIKQMYMCILYYVILYYIILYYCIWYYIILSKEVWKSNFWQYGEMKKQSAGRRVRREKIRRRKMQVREKVGKSRNTVFFRGFVAPEGWKVGSLKRRVRRHLGRWEMKSCTPLWREAHLEVNCVKNWGVRTTFGSWDVEKVHAVVARSTFRSQNVQSTPFSDHFWKLRCRKSARRCGAKHISKSTCTKHTILGPLLEVAMSKKCTPLWREAHFEVKMYKTHQVRTTFGSCDVEKVHAVVARSTFRSQHVQNTTCSRHFWRFRCRKSARRCAGKHISKSKCTKHHMFAPLLEVQMSLRLTTLHYITLHYTPLHYAPLHYTTLHNTTTTTTQLHSTTLHYTKLHYTTLHYTTLHSTTLHYITLHCITFHYTSLHYTTLHYTTLQLQLRLHNYTPLHEITLHYTTLHYTTLHYIPLHSTTLHYITLHYNTLNDTAPQIDR